MEIENMETSQMKIQSFIKTCEPFGITREEATEMWKSYYNLRNTNNKALKSCTLEKNLKNDNKYKIF